MSTNDYLAHYGVKGLKWGVRRYQYADGTYTPAGRRRYSSAANSNDDSFMRVKVRTMLGRKNVDSGKNYADTYLKKGTSFARIQTSQNFEKFAFFATYKESDQNKYLGLYSKNLSNRAKKSAYKAERIARKTNSDADIKNAKELRDIANNTKTYQIRLEATKKLKVPSIENASDITSKLLENDTFKKNLISSIDYSKDRMKRPTQQMLFNQAKNALDKDPKEMSKSEKIAVYKALNLTLTYHEKEHLAVQNKFYSELKKKGYNALLDYNDKEYSSYHAKSPMIVFDVDSVKLNSVTATNPKIVNKMYNKYNRERLVKEIGANTIGFVSGLGTKTVSECESFVDGKIKKYLM